MANPKIEQFQKMVAAYPSSPLPHFSLANAYYEDRRYAEAAAEYEHCLVAQPDWAACLIALGDTYAALGRKDDAAEVLRKARVHATRQGHGTMASEAQEKLEELGFDE